jgi:hypothetical protein
MKSSFILHLDALSILNRMSDDMAGRFIKIIYEYQKTGVLPELDLALDMAITPFINQFERDNIKLRQGERHWNWQQGKSSQNKIIRNSSEIKEWRKCVFERDFYTCQKCLKRGGILHSHHIKRFSEYPELRFDINNGITLCKTCHIKIHKKK